MVVMVAAATVTTTTTARPTAHGAPWRKREHAAESVAAELRTRTYVTARGRHGVEEILATTARMARLRRLPLDLQVASERKAPPPRHNKLDHQNARLA